MVDFVQNPVTENIGAGAGSENQAAIEEFILEYQDYGDTHRMRISLDANALRESFVVYVLGDIRLFSTWEDNERCGCWATSSDLVHVLSLTQVTRGGVELVFSEEVSLSELFSSEDWNSVFFHEVHDRCGVRWAEHTCQNDEEEYGYER